MSNKVKQFAPAIWKEIQKAKKILLCFHPSPDGDSIGSSLAMYHCLKNMGKDVTIIYGDSKFKDMYSFFPGIKEVLQKNYLEIDTTKYDLFITVDSANVEQISKMGDVGFPPNLQVINIDHHKSNKMYGHINLVLDNYPAAAQIVYELLTTLNIYINPEAAICLYLGLYTDTGGFKYPRTTADTLFIASELAKIAPDFPKYIFELENSFTPNQIKYLGLALSSIRSYFGGKVAISEISFDVLHESGIEPRDTDKMEISNILKSAVGWDIGIALTATEKNKCNVSLRTRDAVKYDLSKLALAIGGGGHSAAAGGTIFKPFTEAKKLLLEKIQEVYPDLRQGN